MRRHLPAPHDGRLQIIRDVFRFHRAVAEIHAVFSGCLLQHEAEGFQFGIGGLKQCAVHGVAPWWLSSTSWMWAGGKKSRIHRADLGHAVTGPQKRIDEFADAERPLGRAERGGVIFIPR
jgi:hypothetical protein